MVKTGQLTTKSKGDRFIALNFKTANITLVGLNLERYKHAVTGEVMSKMITRCECDRTIGNYSDTSIAQIHQLPHEFAGKGA